MEATNLAEANLAILTCGLKLQVRHETIASAAIYFQRFFEKRDADEYDAMLVAATSLYLAGKVEEEHLRARDIINVFYSMLNPQKESLELGEEYWSLRDSIVQCELLLLRVLKFHVHNDHPHRYLLHYLKSLSDWIEVSQEERLAFARASWSVLNDFYTNPKCISHSPQEIAIGIINLVLKIRRIDIPFNEESPVGWHEALCDSLSKEKMAEITRDLLSTYKQILELTPEAACLSPQKHVEPAPRLGSSYF